MINIHKNKNGAALVLVLGFLAILMILIIAFATQSRTERLAGRAYLSSAQTRHLLNTALARSLAEIDKSEGGGVYPEFYAIGSEGSGTNRQLLADSIDFSHEEEFIPGPGSALYQAFSKIYQHATEWKSVTNGHGEPVGRVGFIIMNTSGLLDANHVGGLGDISTQQYVERGAGLSPEEIQLDKRLIEEFNQSDTSFPHVDITNPLGVLHDSDNTFQAPALAFVYNRENAWNHFETLRDVNELNRRFNPDIFASNTELFNTFSYSPQNDVREYMGRSEADLATALIKEELEKNEAIPDPDFVLNQLRDYLDTDTLPENEDGEYTDHSVEPVPLINELVLDCNFTFFPQIELNEEGSNEVTSVIITNSYSLNLEAWYPFVGYENANTYAVKINATPEQSAELPSELFADVSEWVGDYNLPGTISIPGSDPHNFEVFSAEFGTTVFGTNEMNDLFADMQSDVQFPSIICTDSSDEKVDQVINLELPLETAVPEELLPIITALSENLFNASTATATSNRFAVAMACIDPRLNGDGENLDHWKEDAAAGENASAGSLGAINSGFISDYTSTPDPTDKIFVRNQDRIDTPWEFTYFLYDQSQPWKTFQMLEENDDDNTRFVMENLSPYAHGSPLHGRVNPYSPYTNVIASVFMNMPLNEFDTPEIERLDADSAKDAAVLFMKHVAENGWPDNAADYGNNIDFDELGQVVKETNPWVLESFFRNTYELFNPRDTLYTILLAAQNGTDANKDGSISDDEVRSTQKAVVYIWRDPKTSKSACVFYGLTDSLQSSAKENWSSILKDFNPEL
jgi:hypothetical protein